MTDNEIVELLEYKAKTHCKLCDLNGKEFCSTCIYTVIKLALDLINRQKAENSNLTSDLTSLQKDLTSAKAEIKRLKKCVAILKDEVGKRERGYDPSEEIDNLLKETVGEDK